MGDNIHAGHGKQADKNVGDKGRQAEQALASNSMVEPSSRG
jgi:hypothetical protein